jgi:putative peptide zinc metalloprotease protein
VVVAGLVALLLLVGVWWPSGQYRAVRADERGSLGALVSRSAPVVPAQQVLAPALVPRSGDGPTLLLLPGADGTQAVLTSGSDGQQAPGTAFPFRLPSAPGPGDNQALALGTKDGGTVYDVAYALVTVSDGSAVDNANTAFALASCSSCTTVAVAFQVVLVVGQADVVAPLNAAVAGNADCFQCTTTALAVQLVVTLRSLPSQEVYDQLAAALSALDDLEGLDTEQLWDAVQAVQAETLQVLTDAGLVEGVTTATASASATPSASPTDAVAAAEPSSTGTPEPTAEPTVTATPSEPPPSPTATSPAPSPSG